MGLTELWRGAKFQVCCTTISNFEAFFDNLEREDATEAAKVAALMAHCAEHGPPRNVEKCRSVGDGMWELKTTRIRIAFFYHSGRIILIHTFLKPKKKAQDAELRTAKRLRKEFLASQEAKK